MSTLAMNKPSRLNIGNQSKRNRSNSLHVKKRRSGPKLTGVGQSIVRFIMMLLTLSFVAVLGVGLLYGYRFITSHAYFELKEIHVTGNDRLTYGSILKCGEVQLGLNCLEMNVGEVENKLAVNPWIKAIRVRREFPDKLHIIVTEKVPMFWVRKGNTLYFADSAGTIIAPMNPGETASLPVLEVATDLDNSHEVLAGLLKMIEDNQTPFTQAQAAWIKLTSAHELEIYLDSHDNGNGLTVRLSMDRWQVQLERLKIVWRDLMRRNEFKDAAIIAASGDKVWVKKRPAES